MPQSPGVPWMISPRSLLPVLLAVTIAALPCPRGHAQGQSVLPDKIDGGARKDMTHRLLRAAAAREQTRWQRAHRERRTVDQIRTWQTQLREQFVDALGGFPTRTPLNASVVGHVDKPLYGVDKITLESRPGFLVTGALFLPREDRHRGPWPAVLVPCGHSREGKGSELYQRACALLAINGIAAFIFDPVDQGERVQLLNDKGGVRMWGTHAHTHAGVGCILLGTNTATHEIWDAMRCLDYLVQRPDIDGERLGCMGNSGGGTQTAYLVALDDRIKAASPSCYITDLYERILDLGPQDAEQNIFGQLAWHMDHADYLTMRAPTPTLICAATRDFFDIRGTWASFRTAKRLYSRLGHPERIELVEHDAKHGYARPLREAAVRWMLRWLAGRDEHITEPADLKILTQQEILCTRHGQVMREPGARSVYDLARERLAKLEESRPPLNPDTVRQVANIRDLAGIPALQVVSRKTTGERVEAIHLSDTRGLHIPAILARPENGEPGHVTLVVDARGKHAAFVPDGIAAQLLGKGHAVCAVDVRGSGETRQSGQTYHRGQGQDGVDVYMAYLLGRSYVGMRAEDILASARWLAAELPGSPIHLHAHGALTVPARHAAYVEPTLISRLTLSDPPPTWTAVIQTGHSDDQLQNAVHGALRAYRLSDLSR